jgi:hypothetical protein
MAPTLRSMLPVEILMLTLVCASSVLSAQGSSTRDRVPPTAPTNLVVTAITERSVTLMWGIHRQFWPLQLRHLLCGNDRDR